MKKLYILLAILISLGLLNAMPSAKSIFFADSYMLRAAGVEANYWNPARINKAPGGELWLPALNTGVSISNNALSLHKYNYFVSRDTLHTKDKEKLLKGMRGKLALSAEASISTFGFTSGYVALSSANHLFAKVRAQEDILRLALYGNNKDEYRFGKEANGADGIAYSDITLGFGGFKLPYLDQYVPDIYIGASLSALAGIGSVETQKFDAIVSNNTESGLSVDLEAQARYATVGAGFKSMLGLYSEVYPNLELGFTLDNIGGSIKWMGDSSAEYYSVWADSIYALNVDEEDLFNEEQESRELDGFESKLPPEMRLAAKYSIANATFSLDYVQGFEHSALTSATGRISAAASYYPVQSLPLIFGISLPNSDLPLKTSYGIAYQGRSNEFGIAVQSFDAIIPCESSKGIAFALSMRFFF
ncbi:MAG: DUF5723 family protein [Candidatus Cloacimonetes bacterium]|nr:DUF5723 family protein [Candidatus Cloacimonadota bacterium]